MGGIREADTLTIQEWSGRLPTHLYRYKSLRGDQQRERVRQILVESKLYFGRFSEMNDPFEGRILPDFQAAAEEVRAYWQSRPEAYAGVAAHLRERRLADLVREASGGGPYPIHNEVVSQYVNQLGVCCFVGSGQDIPMWAYYGDGHRGVCLRFRLDERFLRYTESEAPPIPVKYAEEYPHPRFYDTTVANLVTGLVSTKAEAWCHESEWRIVTQKGPGDRPFPLGILDGVIMGERISKEDASLVRGWIEERRSRTDILQAHSSDSRFAVELRPIGDT